MKELKDYTPKELHELDDDGIQRLIDIEIAIAGVEPYLLPEEPTLEKVGITKSEVVFNVGGLLFINEADAITVSQMELATDKYDYSGAGYDYQWIERLEAPVVSTQQYYNQHDVSRVSAALIDNKNKKEPYRDAKNKHDEFMRLTGEIRNEVYSLVHDAHDFFNRVELAQGVYHKHMSLADNDVAIAEKFFKDAFKNSPEIIEEVLGIDPSAKVDG